jgi:preprotein translocase subunit SecG
MVIALTVLHVMMCFSIIGIVLLQAGKGADIGSAFGGAGSQAVFGSMGTPTLLGKITTGVALLFAITSFTLALLGGERASSVVREPAPVTAPAAPAPSTPSAPSAPSATPPQSAPNPVPTPPSAPATK